MLTTHLFIYEEEQLTTNTSPRDAVPNSDPPPPSPYPSPLAHISEQGPRIVWKLGWGVENSVSKCGVRVENSVLKQA